VDTDNVPSISNAYEPSSQTTPQPTKKRRHEELEENDEPGHFRRVRLRVGAIVETLPPFQYLGNVASAERWTMCITSRGDTSTKNVACVTVGLPFRHTSVELLDRVDHQTLSVFALSTNFGHWKESRQIRAKVGMAISTLGGNGTIATKALRVSMVLGRAPNMDSQLKILMRPIFTRTMRQGRANLNLRPIMKTLLNRIVMTLCMDGCALLHSLRFVDMITTAIPMAGRAPRVTRQENILHSPLFQCPCQSWDPGYLLHHYLLHHYLLHHYLLQDTSATTTLRAAIQDGNG